MDCLFFCERSRVGFKVGFVIEVLLVEVCCFDGFDFVVFDYVYYDVGIGVVVIIDVGNVCWIFFWW